MRNATPSSKHFVRTSVLSAEGPSSKFCETMSTPDTNSNQNSAALANSGAANQEDQRRANSAYSSLAIARCGARVVDKSRGRQSIFRLEMWYRDSSKEDVNRSLRDKMVECLNHGQSNNPAGNLSFEKVSHNDKKW